MLFASTSCLKGRDSKFEKDVMHVLGVYRQLRISNIELGAAHSLMPSLSPLLKYQKDTGCNFICHANFPPSSEKLFLNLCSQSPNMQKSVMASAKASIELLNKMGGSLYSVHFGFLADMLPNLMQMSEKAPYQKAFDTGANTLGQVCDYAQYYNVNVAVENQPPHGLLLLSKPQEMKELLKKVARKNLGLLIDLGHMALTEKKLGIPRSDFAKLQEKAFEFHVHEIVGENDHQKLTSPSVFAGFDREILMKSALTLEATGLTEKQIMESLALISRAVQE